MRDELQERLGEARAGDNPAEGSHASRHSSVARNQQQRQEVLKVYAPEGRFSLPYTSLGKTFLSTPDNEGVCTLELDFLTAVVTIRGYALALLDDSINDHMTGEIRKQERGTDFHIDDEHPLVLSIAVKPRD